MKTPRFKKIQSIFTTVLMTVALAVAGIGLLATVGHNGPMKVLVVQTGSMEPTIPVGSLVITRHASDYQIGDVVTYKLGGNFVTHRVVAKTNGTYQTKGDANNSPDGGLVLPSAIAGKAFISLPYVGKFISFVKTPLGFSLLIVLPALFVVIQEIMAIGKELAKMEATKLKLQPAFVTDVRPPLNGLPLQTTVTGKSKTRKRAKRRTGGVSKSVRIRVTKRRQPVRSRKATITQSEAPTKNRLVHAVIILAVTMGSLLGGTKAYFSDLGFSDNNVYITGQYIATTLVINELMYDSSCTPNPEQKIAIELWNGSASTVNLKDWSLKDQNGNIVQISNANFNLAPGQFVLLSKSNSTFVANCYGVPPSGVGSLNLGGSIVVNTTAGSLELLDSSSTVIDKVAYGSPNPIAAEDKSIERRQFGFDTAVGSTFNASDFISRFPATLGFGLPSAQAVVINEFMVAPDSGAVQEFIELRNNSLASVNISGWKLYSGDGTNLEATVPAATTLATGQRYLHQFTAGGNEIANSDDRLYLKDASSVIRDAFSYHRFAPTSGTSWSRIPEGTNTWVLDATQTPGALNIL